MKRQPVSSSNIKSIGHDPVTSTLEVEFHNGGIYHYHGVPAAKHAALLAEDTAPGGSVGSHFHRHIRNVHKFTKLSK